MFLKEKVLIRGRATATNWYEEDDCQFCPPKQAYIEFFEGKTTIFLFYIGREQNDISFGGTSGIPRQNKIRKGLTG